MSVPAAKQAAALADWDAGMSRDAVAAKHGVSIGALSLWRKQRADGGRQKVTERAPPSKMTLPEKGGKRSGKKAKESVIAKAQTDEPDARARALIDLAAAPEMARQLRLAAWGMGGYLARVGAAHAAYLHAEGERAKLRADGRTPKEVDELCPLPPYPDMRQMDAGARALRTTLEIAPGLASFDADTGGSKGGAEAPTPQEQEAMDQVMLAESGGLAILDGGKARAEGGG